MGFRMRRSIKVAPGVRLNISAKSIGVSAGVPGARVSANSRGRVTTSVGVPGTGISYVKSSTFNPRSSTQPARPAVAAGASAKKPGMLSPAWEKALYKRVVSEKGPTYLELAEQYPEASHTIQMMEALLVAYPARDGQRLSAILDSLYEANYEPADDAFLNTYTRDGRISLEVAPGVSADMPLSRSALAIQLAEIEQGNSNHARAIEIVESIEPTTIAAVSLAELYAAEAQWDEIVDLTTGIANDDEASTYLLMQRGKALREQGYFEASREAFKEALRVRSRPTELRNYAYLERGRTYLAENKPALARKDFERILATDSNFPGIRGWIAAAGGAAVDESPHPPLAMDSGGHDEPAATASSAEPTAAPTMEPVRVPGYGASLEFDDTTVAIIFGKMASSVTGTAALRIPYSGVEGVDFKDASLLVNGCIAFRVSGGPAHYAVPPTTRRIDPSMCRVHFRHKDRAEFAAAYERIRGLAGG